MALEATTTGKVFAKTAEMTTENITPKNVYLKMKETGIGQPIGKEQRKQSITETRRI